MIKHIMWYQRSNSIPDLLCKIIRILKPFARKLKGSIIVIQNFEDSAFGLEIEVDSLLKILFFTNESYQAFLSC